MLFHTEAHADRVAVLLPGGERLSHRELAARADVAAEALRGTDLAAVECDNSIGSLVAYLACLRRHVPVLLVDAGLDEGLKDTVQRQYGVSVVYRPAAADWVRGGGTAPRLHPELAVLLSTSGSTGSPKLVRLSRRNIQANAESICQYLALSDASRAITALPMQYSFGLSIIHSHLLAGGSVALTPQSITERGFWDFFRASECDSFSGVPTMYEMLRRLRFERMALPSLRTLTQAGGRLAPESVRWFAELAAQRDWRFFVMYGQTEATARMAYLPPDLAIDHPDSVGVAIPGGSFELRGADGQPVERNGEIGELVYRGPNVMLGYAEAADDLALGDVQQGVLATGDLAERDAAGLHYVRGRTKRFVKVFGLRMSLDDIEGRLRGSGLDVRVTGRDDLLVVAGTDAAAVASAVDGIASTYRIHRSALAGFAVETLPVSAAGKVLYGNLLEQFDTRKASA